MSRPRLLPLSGTLFVLCLLPAHAADNAFELIGRTDFNGALKVLEAPAANASPKADAQRRLLAAAASLNAQPRTQSRIDDALASVRAVVAENPTDDSVRVPGLFLEARMLQEHIEPRQPEAAAVIYEGLVDNRANPLLARRALIALAFIRLYDAPKIQAREARIASVEALLAHAIEPATQRDLHYLIAQTQLAWGIAGLSARNHLKAAVTVGFKQRTNQANALVAMAQLSEDLGDVNEARGAYQAFLEIARRDSRADTIRARLALLDAKKKGAQS